MSDNNPNKWLTLDESIAEDIGDNTELKARFDDAGDRVEVASQIYQIRNSYNLTRSQFGKIVGISADKVAKIERMNFTEPPEQVYELVCQRMSSWVKRINSMPEPLLTSHFCAITLPKTKSTSHGG